MALWGRGTRDRCLRDRRLVPRPDPRRRRPDPAAGPAHPLRLRLLRLLREHQPATGARLAELTGSRPRASAITWPRWPSTASLSATRVRRRPGGTSRGARRSSRCGSSRCRRTDLDRESRGRDPGLVAGGVASPAGRLRPRPLRPRAGAARRRDLRDDRPDADRRGVRGASEAVQQAIGRFRNTAPSADRSRFDVSFVGIPIAVPTDALRIEKEGPL